MELTKIHSITKKICVALLGAFLLIFLLFHACANLCILRDDDGAWYTAFCHFMGTNLIVKVFEVILFACLIFHIIITVWLWFTNKAARPVGYHVASRSKTHTGSKLQIWTGILLVVFFAVHFCDFYFCKMGWVEGSYIVKTENVMKSLQENGQESLAPFQSSIMLAQQCAQSGTDPQEFIEGYKSQLEMANQNIDITDSNYQQEMAQMEEQMKQVEEMEAGIPAAKFFMSIMKGEENASLDAETKAAIEEALPGLECEPDFYTMARNKFANPWLACIYLFFFVVVWFHMRHAFPAAFQTLGLNNYKYNRAIEVCALIYAWVVCLAFAAVPIGVLLF